jgi:hypothetical protein
MLMNRYYIKAPIRQRQMGELFSAGVLLCYLIFLALLQLEQV